MATEETALLTWDQLHFKEPSGFHHGACHDIHTCYAR